MDKIIKGVISAANSDKYEALQRKAAYILKEIKLADKELKLSPTDVCGCLLEVIEKNNEEIEALKASMLKLASSKSESRSSGDRFRRERPTYEKVDFVANPNAQRFFINLGEKDGINKVSLMDLIISNYEGLKREDFSDSYTKDTFSFFELPKDYSEQVLEIMNGVNYKGRVISVELSEKKNRSESSSRSRGSSSRRDFKPRNDRGDRRPSRSSFSRDSKKRTDGSRRNSSFPKRGD